MTSDRAEVQAECESLGAEEVAARLAAGSWVSPADTWARDWLTLADRRADRRSKINAAMLQAAATTAAIIAAIGSIMVLLK